MIEFCVKPVGKTPDRHLTQNVYEVIYNFIICRMNQEIVNISLIEANEGQIVGVPSNPRTISIEKMEALKRSIQSLPDMLSIRELLVYPLNGRYIVLGGNMRYRACLALGCKEIPCKVVPKNTPSDKLRAIVIQDNNSYGETDWDIIANEWDVNELKDWSMDLPADWEITPDNFSDGFSLPDGEKPNSEKLTFTVSSEQADLIKTAIDFTKSNGLECETFGNENSNGNALYQIVKQWEEQRK